MTEILYSTGDALQWTFINVLEPLGNLPNTVFIIAGFVALGYCLSILNKPTANG